MNITVKICVCYFLCVGMCFVHCCWELKAEIFACGGRFQICAYIYIFIYVYTYKRAHIYVKNPLSQPVWIIKLILMALNFLRGFRKFWEQMKLILCLNSTVDCWKQNKLFFLLATVSLNYLTLFLITRILWINTWWFNDGSFWIYYIYFAELDLNHELLGVLCHVLTAWTVDT